MLRPYGSGSRAGALRRVFSNAGFRTCLALLVVAVGTPAAGATISDTETPAESEKTREGEPPPAAQESQPATRVDVSGGGVTISSGMNSLTIGARMQFRWTVDRREQADTDAPGTVGFGGEDGVMSQFDVPRLRLTLSGGVFRPWMRYSFQFELSRTSGAGGSRIKDAIFEIRPVDRPYRVQVGQFKVPFGLQELTSSGRLQFVDRAITDAKFAPARDMGAMLAGTAVERKIGYEAGVFNGSGESQPQTTRGALYVGRVFVQPFGPYALAESATEALARPVLHLGLAARGGKQVRGRTPAGVVEDADNQTAIGGEFAVKSARVYSTAEYFWMRDEQQNPLVGPDITSRGFHAQVGYMVIPRTTDVGVLYAQINGDTGVADANVREIRAVVGHFWRGHNLKVQADVGQLRYDAGYLAMPARARQGLPTLGPRLVTGQSLADIQIRTQLQVAF